MGRSFNQAQQFQEGAFPAAVWTDEPDNGSRLNGQVLNCQNSFIAIRMFQRADLIDWQIQF